MYPKMLKNKVLEFQSEWGWDLSWEISYTIAEATGKADITRDGEKNIQERTLGSPWISGANRRESSNKRKKRPLEKCKGKDWSNRNRGRKNRQVVSPAVLCRGCDRKQPYKTVPLRGHQTWLEPHWGDGGDQGQNVWSEEWPEGLRK